MTRVLQFPGAAKAPTTPPKTFPKLGDKELALAAYIEVGRALEAGDQSPHLVVARDLLRALCARLLGVDPVVPHIDQLATLVRIAEVLNGGDA